MLRNFEQYKICRIVVMEKYVRKDFTDVKISKKKDFNYKIVSCLELENHSLVAQ